MATTIQRQAILSTLFTYIGFGFGAVNLLVLQPHLLSQEQFGLTRVINEFSILVVSLASLGANSASGRFFSFYKDYLPYKKNDLPFITATVTCIGMAITLVALLLLKKPIIHFYHKSPLFADYYWIVFPFAFFYIIFSFIEPFSWYAGKTVLSNTLKETAQRLLFTCLLLALAFHLINFNGFITVFAFSYAVPAIILFVVVRRAKGLPFTTQFSVATKRMKKKIFSFSAFFYLTMLVAAIAQTVGTLFLGGLQNLGNAGVFAIAMYFSSVIEVPSRTIVGSAIPVLQGYWRVKNMSGLESIYKKSAMNMLVVGLGLGGLITVNLPSIILFLGKGGSDFSAMLMPAIILLLAKLVELSTGLNTHVLHTSNRWAFDFKSTMIYSVLSVPLNYFLIKHFGMLGAAFAALITALFYNIYRCVFLYVEFKLQPFSKKNIELFILAIILITVDYFIPTTKNLYLDSIIKSILFVGAFGYLLITRKYSSEVVILWNKWGGKFTGIIKK